MTDQHPITPPPGLLVSQWEDEWHHLKIKHIDFESYIAYRAAQWGADQELEACIAWLDDTDCDDPQETAQRLRQAMRPTTTTQENNNG